MMKYKKMLFCVKFRDFTHFQDQILLILKVHFQVWDSFWQLKAFKNDENFISPQKLFLFSRYLNFCLDFLVMYQNGLNRKIRLIANFMTSQSG